MASVLRERTEGYAQKLKTSIPVVGTAWNRRYFVLREEGGGAGEGRDAVLEYYADKATAESRRDAKGTWTMRDLRGVRAIADAAGKIRFAHPDQISLGKDSALRAVAARCLELDFGAHRPCRYLQMANSDDRDMWIDALRAVTGLEPDARERVASADESSATVTSPFGSADADGKAGEAYMERSSKRFVSDASDHAVGYGESAAESAAAGSEPLLEGYLWKLKQVMPLVGTGWNRRYFRVEHRYVDKSAKGELCLCYYADHAASEYPFKCKGELRISSIATVRAVLGKRGRLRFSRPQEISDAKRNVIQPVVALTLEVDSDEGKYLLLQASDAAEVDRWVTGLREAKRAVDQRDAGVIRARSHSSSSGDSSPDGKSGHRGVHKLPDAAELDAASGPPRDGVHGSLRGGGGSTGASPRDDDRRDRQSAIEAPIRVVPDREAKSEEAKLEEGSSACESDGERAVAERHSRRPEGPRAGESRKAPPHGSRRRPPPHLNAGEANKSDSRPRHTSAAARASPRRCGGLTPKDEAALIGDGSPPTPHGSRGSKSFFNSVFSSDSDSEGSHDGVGTRATGGLASASSFSAVPRDLRHSEGHFSSFRSDPGDGKVREGDSERTAMRARMLERKRRRKRHADRRNHDDDVGGARSDRQNRHSRASSSSKDSDDEEDTSPLNAHGRPVRRAEHEAAAPVESIDDLDRAIKAIPRLEELSAESTSREARSGRRVSPLGTHGAPRGFWQESKDVE